MSAQDVITVSAAVVAIVQFVKWAGVPDGKGPLAVLVLSLLGVGFWAFSQGNFARATSFDYFAGYIAVVTSAAGVFGFTRAANTAVTGTRPTQPATGAGASPTVNVPNERGAARPEILGVIALTILALAVGGVLVGLGGLARRAHETAKIDAYARGYEEGLTDGMRVNPLDHDDALAGLDRCADLAACRGRLAELEAEEESNVHAIAYAGERGWEDGYRLGREDWKALPYDCRALEAR